MLFIAQEANVLNDVYGYADRGESSELRRLRNLSLMDRNIINY